MFKLLTKSNLHQTRRYGNIDAPAVSEETLEKYNGLYDQITAGADQINALVLGATPELRDIVLSHHHNLTTVDRDTKALAQKNQDMHYQNHLQETIVQQDWLTAKFEDNTFDVIIGDGVLTALNKSAHETLLTKIHDWLKPTGTLLLREGTVLHRRPRYAPSVHIHEYRTGQYNIFDLFFGLRLYNSHFTAIDRESRKTYLNVFHEKINDYFNNGLLSEREREALDSLAEELEHTLLLKEDLEDLLKTFFFPKEIVHDIGSGHLSPWYFFLLQPNDDIELPEHVPNHRSS